MTKKSALCLLLIISLGVGFGACVALHKGQTPTAPAPTQPVPSVWV